MPAPIALFVYKRLSHAKRTIEALAANTLANESDLFIFSDGAKTELEQEAIDQIRVYLKSVSGFRKIEIFQSAVNKGLANSIIDGVTTLLKTHEAIIVIEDDLLTSPFFLSYINQGIDLYKSEPSVISIHGYIYPVKTKLPDSFFLRGADCWGWATWRNGWELFEKDGAKLLAELKERKLNHEFDFDNSFPYTQMLNDQIEGLNDSWAVRWYASAFLKNKLTLYPGISFVQNIGLDNSGTHSGQSNRYDTILMDRECYLEKLKPVEDIMARKIVSNYLASGTNKGIKNLIKKVIRVLKLT